MQVWTLLLLTVQCALVNRVPEGYVASLRLPADDGDIINLDLQTQLAHRASIESAVDEMLARGSHAALLFLLTDASTAEDTATVISMTHPHACAAAEYVLSAWAPPQGALRPGHVLDALERLHACVATYAAAGRGDPEIVLGTRTYARAHHLAPFAGPDGDVRVPYTATGSVYRENTAFARVPVSRTRAHGNTCIVCMNDMDEEGMPAEAHVLPCAHVMCGDCAQPALDMAAKCPVCRAPAFPNAHVILGNDNVIQSRHYISPAGVIDADMTDRERAVALRDASLDNADAASGNLAGPDIHDGANRHDHGADDRHVHGGVDGHGDRHDFGGNRVFGHVNGGDYPHAPAYDVHDAAAQGHGRELNFSQFGYVHDSELELVMTLIAALED